MSFSSKEEYLEYINDVYHGEYYEEDHSDTMWHDLHEIASERLERYKNQKNIPNTSSKDVSNCKSEEIKNYIFQYFELTVNDFIVKIHKYDVSKNNLVKFGISFWYHAYKTPSGHPCNMVFKLNLKKDSRFNSQSWVEDSVENKLYNLSSEKLVEIIKYLQYVVKYKPLI